MRCQISDLTPEEATAKVQLSWPSGGGIGTLFVYVTPLDNHHLYAVPVFLTPHNNA